MFEELLKLHAVSGEENHIPTPVAETPEIVRFPAHDTGEVVFGGATFRATGYDCHVTADWGQFVSFATPAEAYAWFESSDFWYSHGDGNGQI